MKKTILILITVAVLGVAVWVYLKQTNSLPFDSQPLQSNSEDQSGDQRQLDIYNNDEFFPEPEPGQKELTPEEFVRNYLEAYKNIATKKNFAEVKNFLTSDALIFMQSEGVPLETNYTSFDSFEVLDVENLGNHYVSKVKLSGNGQLLKNPDGGEAIEIDFIRQGENFKAETWYFTQ
ncbi:MAG: hypothetical protein A2Y98_01775 [Candidatus Portnoybacteria bacterium RBG_19FT_COMBO_36_7]|uniref:Uncharacterized protein n=1 Tax=Candidatus Portnoybacteria bacterium RBG_19FT_COMBO_36_7 TaxID=1801992 RepID=A0A1G2F7V2_9BACT|nr:MAG: hypothetical protein A2Y98_01775 [Candidatus Portnoybacteria bacterium RBG_19FT_COMBO_36_7]